jgi:hypothetical protein
MATSGVFCAQSAFWSRRCAQIRLATRTLHRYSDDFSRRIGSRHTFTPSLRLWCRMWAPGRPHGSCPSTSAFPTGTFSRCATPPAQPVANRGRGGGSKWSLAHPTLDQVVHFPHATGAGRGADDAALRIEWDPQWLAIVRAAQPFMSRARRPPPLPPPEALAAQVAREGEWVREASKAGNPRSLPATRFCCGATDMGKRDSWRVRV